MFVPFYQPLISPTYQPLETTFLLCFYEFDFFFYSKYKQYHAVFLFLSGLFHLAYLQGSFMLT